MSRLLRHCFVHAIDDEIGTRAEQCANATKDSGIAEWDHQLGKRDAVLLAPIADTRNEHGHQGRRLHKGGHNHRREHHPGDGTCDRFGSAEDSFGDPSDAARVANAFANDEQHADGDDLRIGEAFKGLPFRNNARQ